MNLTEIQTTFRQISGNIDDEVLEGACDAEFPKLYEDRLTTPYMVGQGWIDEVALDIGPLYHCCKLDADVVIDYPPTFSEELFSVLYLTADQNLRQKDYFRV